MKQHTRRNHGRGLLLALGASASRAVGQATSSFVDQATGAQLQRFVDSKTNFGFGIGLPAISSDSFIGQLSFPLADGAGWGGISLNGDAKAPPLLACWPDGNGGVVSSFRQTPNGDGNPSQASGAFTLKTIPEATSANSTFLTFTFLCEGCIDDTRSVDAASVGWRLGSRPVQNAASAAGILPSPDRGFGDFLADLAAARSSDFDNWAALATGTASSDPSLDTSAVDGSVAVSDLKARQSGSNGRAGGRSGFDTDSGLSGNETDGVDSDSDDDRARAPRAAARSVRLRRRSAAASNLATRQAGGQTGGSRTGGRAGFNTDTDNSGDESGFDSDTNSGRPAPRAGGRVSRARSLAKRQKPGKNTGRNGNNTDTGNSGNDLTSGVDSDSDNGRAGVARVARTSRARRLARRQTRGSRNGFNTDTDNNGLTSGIDSASDSDNGRRGTAARTGGRVPRARDLTKRQTRGRNGFNTDTDNNGLTSGIDSARDSDNARKGAATRTGGRVPRPRALARRQTRGRGRNGSNTDTDGNGLTSGVDSASDSDNGRRGRARAGRAAATRAVGGGATIPSGLTRRQAGGNRPNAGGRGRGGFDTDSGNDSGNSLDSLDSLDSQDSLDSSFSDFSD